MSILKYSPSLSTPWETLDPFLFCVYHKDQFPPGDELMRAPRRGNGADFNPNAPYRMYHGDRVPGFPAHPHKGFETITATIEGLVDHTDSLGNGGRYGQGDLQWMTAGRGIVHGENFPLINQDRDNPARFFQIWINLPKSNKLVDPSYVMHWAENIPLLRMNGASIRLFAGQLEHEGSLVRALAPPTASWAANPENGVTVLHVVLEPNGEFTLPPTTQGHNRRAYFFEGAQIEIDGQSFNKHGHFTLDPVQATRLRNPHNAPIEVLVLGGKPINEPVAQRGPFVMNTMREIQEAFMEYQLTQFGGWPYTEDAVIFPRERGRFSNQKGVDEFPPSSCK